MLFRITRPVVFAFSMWMAFALGAQAQDKPADPAPDVLVFSNGDQLTGHLVSSAGGSVVFNSDMAGSLTIPFSKVKELRAGSKASEFALLKKGLVVKTGTPAPEGTISIADGKVAVHPSGPATSPDAESVASTIPADQVNYLVPRAEFDKQVRGHQSFFADWNGAVTGGATLVRATTNATTLTLGVGLIRSTPTVSWLAPRDRTTLNIMESYGKNTSPGAIPQTNPPAKNITTLASIFHADSERDQYFSARFYALGDVAFDHNYSQGLSLQQIYGGGIGWTIVKDAKQELDLKADIHYETQKYLGGVINGVPTVAAPSTQLVGSTIFEGYHRALPRKMVFTQSLNLIPSYNIAADYSANVNTGLTLPVFKRLSAAITASDSFLNDPAPGYKKNSFQFVTGVTYNLR
ncbi:Protein of unknown function, DUF481 [Bryocella elongata]|uniref:Salt-induced outer membrane protein YdiY n=1 Tax=Bryocella elongata TaxID=863522 RepID=A0A1H5W8G6_9BACT|nr:DUF481 domain-containing protein [Bryocella elongata]SEF95849.1 Protein of unknown function, DUF481 [Bryocella elongata]